METQLLSDVCDVTLIETIEEADLLCAKALQSRECAVDTETNGLIWARGHKAFMATFCPDTKSVFACYDPTLTAYICAYFTASQIYFVFHNAIFDLHMLRAWTHWRPEEGYKSLHVHDTMHAMRIQHPGRSAKLKDCSQTYVQNIDVTAPQAAVYAWIAANTTVDEIAGKRVVTKPTYDMVPRDIMTPYALQDVYLTLRLHHALTRERIGHVRQGKHAEMFPTLDYVYQRETLLTKIVADMEYAGLNVDMDRLYALLDQCAVEIASLEEKWKALTSDDIYPDGVNIGSPKQLAEFFYGKLGEVVKHITDSGAPSTGELALRDMTCREAVDIIYPLKKWTQCQNRLTEILSYVATDGKVHTSIKSEAAKTGRFSSSGPALQNHSRPIPGREYTQTRSVFSPEAGREWLFVDYSQIELRLAAYFMRSAPWIDAFENDIDLHTLTAARMYGADVAYFTHVLSKDFDGDAAEKKAVKLKRSPAKTTNFRILYGGGARGLAEAFRFGAGGADPLTPDEARAALGAFLERKPLPESEAYDGITRDAWLRDYWRMVDADKTDAKLFECLAKELLETYHAENPFVKNFTKTASKIGKARGYVTTAFGLNIPVDPERAYAVPNFIIQGSAAGLMKETIIRVEAALQEWCQENNLRMWHDVQINMTIHDELILSVPIGTSLAIAKKLKPVMENWPQFNVPIKVEFALVPHGGNWANKKDLHV